MTNNSFNKFPLSGLKGDKTMRLRQSKTNELAMPKMPEGVELWFPPDQCRKVLCSISN